MRTRLITSKVIRKGEWWNEELTNIVSIENYPEDGILEIGFRVPYGRGQTHLHLHIDAPAFRRILVNMMEVDREKTVEAIEYASTRVPAENRG